MESFSQATPGSLGGDYTLVVMAKAPKPGAVKTRLAQSLPPTAVVELYRCLLDDTLALATSSGGVALRRDSRRCLRIAPRLGAVASSRSTATARTSRRRHCKARFKHLPKVTSLLDRRTTEAITSSARLRLIRDSSRATGSEPRMHARRYLGGRGRWGFQ